MKKWLVTAKLPVVDGTVIRPTPEVLAEMSRIAGMACAERGVPVSRLRADVGSAEFVGDDDTAKTIAADTRVCAVAVAEN